MSIEYILEQLRNLDKRLQQIETNDAVPIIAIASLITTNQTIVTGTPTAINFNNSEEDTRVAITTSPNWRFNAPVGGYYSVKSHIVMGDLSASWAIGEEAKLMVYKNGAEYKVIAKSNNTVAGGTPLMNGSTDIELVKNDYVELFVNQTSGANQSILAGANLSWIAIHRIRGY